jgi:beta-glucosidase
MFGRPLRFLRTRRRRHVAALAVVAVVGSVVVAVASPAYAASNLAPFGVASATSSENGGLGPEKAIDGDPTTRWSSAFSDPQTITIDLGARAQVASVTLLWEPAYSTAYTVETSLDGATWTKVFETTSGDGGTDEIPGIDRAARYIRLTGTARATPYGHSIYEFGVFGEFTEQAVTLGASGATLPENGTVSIPVKLNKAADHPVTVAYATADGTATAGADYKAASGTLTFPPGTTEQAITLTGVDDGTHENAERFDVALSNATPAGTLIAPRDKLTVSISDNDPLPFDGKTLTIDDFDSGVPAGLVAFGGDASNTPTLAPVPAGDRPGAAAGNQALKLTYAVTSYGGISRGIEAQDWSQFDGFSFWANGSGTGASIQFEVKDGGADSDHAELFEAFYTDDFAGWRKVQVPFRQFKRRTSYQPPGAPTDGKLELKQMRGYAINLPQTSGTLALDQVEIYQQVLTIDRFDGEVPIANPPGPGLFTFGSNAADNPRLSFEPFAREGAPAGNKVLRGEYNISGWGGIVHNVSFDTDPQDWSGFLGVRFWWYGTNTAPLPPGSGPRFFLEVKDGGANAEASELWNTSFTDDWQGWHLVEIPFSQFVYRGDYQPVGGIDHVLTLTQSWGYAFTLPAGRDSFVRVDDFQVYGVSPGAPVARVSTDKAVYVVDEGDTATVRVVLTTTSGKPLEEPVTVKYRTGTGSATPGTDYQATSGELVFAAGTASGATMTFPVMTLADKEAETADAIPIEFESETAANAADQTSVVINAHGLPYLNPKLSADKRAADVLGRMTLDEKVGQMTQAERNALQKQSDIATSSLGSMLSGGGSVPSPNTPQAWADMVDAYQLRTRQTRLQIPLIYGVDAVHGHNNVIGATLFPHNVGLGSTRNPALVETAGHVTATEVRATGIPWDFSPCLCVSRDDRWGRAYESFSEDPALVNQMNTIIDGMQGSDLTAGDRVLATAKHWVGDGGTRYGSSTTGNYKIDQGVTEGTRDELFAVHILPYRDAVKKGVGTVMPSYSSVDFVGDDAGPVKMHGNADLITNVLKGELKFDGFVISDWQAIDQLPGDYPSDVRTSINAGLDMIMVPTQYQTFEQTLKAEVEAGRVPMARVDDAVTRILRQKFRLGLFDKPFADRTHLAEVGSAAHRDVARQAAAQSQVLLKNTDKLLPLKKDAKIYVAGGSADDLGNQMGGWSVSWQGASGATTQGTTILAGIKQVAPTATVTYSKDAAAPMTGNDVGVVVVGEVPYAEGIGDVGVGPHTLKLYDADAAVVDKVCGAMKCVVLVVSGRPLVMPDKISKAAAVVASWLPGTEGAGVADVLFGARPFTGRLSMTWPKNLEQLPINVGDATYDPQYAYGWGLRTDSAKDRLVAVRNALKNAPKTDKYTKSAVKYFEFAIAARVWNADGSVADPTMVQAWLTAGLQDLTRTDLDSYAQNDAVVAVLRDIAQWAVVKSGAGVPAGVAGLTADADHELASGHPDVAADKLTDAYWTVVLNR